MKNRFMLAPLTNEQSGYTDGILSQDEYTWLTKRAEGGFGCTMTCASHVQSVGQGFAGQLGCWNDGHIEGLNRLAAGIKRHDSVAIVQLHHAGNRTPKELIGTRAPVCPSPDEKRGARELSLAEVEQLVEDFITAALRCQEAGFDGVELHGAHGYILCQFLSAKDNRRTDKYGGTRANRERIVREIIVGIKQLTR
jgi:2,4-dienoyl-CoA reductase-like NADH-dependent reductase (Old Yellow Enzyme family)